MSALTRFISIILVVWSIIPASLSAQSADNSSNQGVEVYLAFRYKGAINTVVTALARDEKFYLPVTELFSLLKINYDLNIKNMAISGYYLNPDRTYRIGFQDRYARMGEKWVEISADDVILSEIDFYMVPKIFEEIFGLKFTVDFYHLTLELVSNETLPVIAETQRSRQRDKQLQTFTGIQQNYPLLLGRHPSLLNGGFLDYSTFTRLAEAGNIMTYNLQMGGEVLTGDLQGTVTGIHTPRSDVLGTTGMRWRYVKRNLPAFSTLKIGQMSTNGILGNNVTGVGISNEPVEPQRLYDNYVIDGVTVPQSEVELYRNSQLIGFVKADERGYYRFTIPLTYGSADLSLKIYNPNGGVTEQDRHVQVPFTFIPPGQMYYNIYGGKQQITYTPLSQAKNVFQADMAYGLNNWVTAKLGVDYEKDIHADHPFFYSSLATRLGLQYLLNLDIAPGIYYRVQMNATYPSAAGWRIDYTAYDGSSVLNPSSRQQAINANMYYPFFLKNLQFLTQFSGGYLIYSTDKRLEYRSLISTSFFRVRTQLSYRGIFSSATGLLNGVLTPALTYTIPRSREVPGFIRGMYFRAELQYKMQTSRADKFNFQILKNLSRQARYRFTYSRDIRQKYNIFEFTLSYDFDYTRSTSSIRTNRDVPTFTQTFRGSVGYDSHYETLNFDNRQQVGRSAASIRMYVDSNNSGTLDKGEKEIDPDAIRVRNTTGRITEKDSIARLTQLQAYRRYNLEINEAKIKNPVWVPKIKEFSIVTDPNSYKQIDIPFFITGIVDGNVLRRKDEQLFPVAGLRVHLDSPEENYHKTMLTFSDGSFYAMEIPPGEYRISVDSTQLEFLGVESNPNQRQVQVKALPEGDFVEDLNFILTTLPPEKETPGAPKCRYFVQVGLFSTWEQAVLEQVTADQLFNARFNILYNKDFDLFAVVSEWYPNRDIAKELRELVRNKLYQDAFVGEDCPPFERVLQYRVHLGAFDTQITADQFADSLRNILPEDVIVKQYDGDAHYHVILPGYNDWQRSFELLSTIQSENHLNSAGINLESPFRMLSANDLFRIQIGVYSQDNQAAQVLETVSAQAGYHLQIIKDPETGLLHLQTEPFTALDQAKQAESVLSAISGINPEIIPVKNP